MNFITSFIYKFIVTRKQFDRAILERDHEHEIETERLQLDVQRWRNKFERLQGSIPADQSREIYGEDDSK
jgi:hypothetical protein